MKTKTAIVLGATGLIGSYCLEHLLKSDEYEKVIALVRKSTGMSHPKLIQQQIDFDSMSEYANLFAADDVFCCLGTTIKVAGSQDAFRKVDYTYVAEAARLAANKGCRQFLVVSSIGANSKSSNFYLRVKGEMEEAVQKNSLEAIHIFRPSMLLGPRKEFRLGERIGKVLMTVFAPLLFGSLRKYKPIQAETVAKTMLDAAKTGKAGTHVYFYDNMIRTGR